jgi:hypothetical protein
MADYSPPLAQLLSRGQPGEMGDPWADYLALGFTQEHIPELIRMATDLELEEEEGDSPTVWAPLHAWRALGQLRAVEAIEPLVRQLVMWHDRGDDWAPADLPQVFTLMGPPAVPRLLPFLEDDSLGTFSRMTLFEALERLGQEHPDTVEAITAATISFLEHPADNDPVLNACAVNLLVTFRVLSAVPLMEQAFQKNLVETSLSGSWEHIRYDLGLRPDPPPREPLFPFGEPPVFHPEAAPDRANPKATTPRERAKKRAKKRRQKKRGH